LRISRKLKLNPDVALSPTARTQLPQLLGLVVKMWATSVAELQEHFSTNDKTKEVLN